MSATEFNLTFGDDGQERCIGHPIKHDFSSEILAVMLERPDRLSVFGTFL
jgi:hypothetical protein